MTAKTPLEITSVIEPFRLMEFMGWGWGDNRWCYLTIPAGSSVQVQIPVEEDEVWWVVFAIFDAQPNSFLLRWGTDSEEHLPLLLHTGWISAPLCPPGWHRAEEFCYFNFENVSGDPTYNNYAAETLTMYATVFLFRARTDKVKQIDEMIERFMEERSRRVYP